MSVWIKDSRQAVGYPGQAVEDDIIYSGYLAKAMPLLAEGYHPGEEAMLHVEGHAERIGPGWTAWLSWATTYKVFKSDGTPITSDTRHHSIAPWTTHDYAEDRLDLELGPMPEVPIAGYVELWVGGSPDVLVDTKEFAIPLYGEAPTKFPWKWVGIGAGVVLAAIVISRRGK